MKQLKSLPKNILLRQIAYFLFASVLLLGILVFIEQLEPDYTLSVFLVTFLALLIPASILIKKHIDPFEPLVLFSILYYAFVFYGFLLLFDNFNNTYYLIGFTQDEIIYYFNTSIIFLIVGFVSFCFGYYIFIRKKKPKNIIFNRNDEKIPSALTVPVVCLFICIGSIAFIWISFQVAGNPINYLLQIDQQYGRLQKLGISDIWFQFMYAGMYIWFYLLLRKQKQIDIFSLSWISFFLFLGLSFAMILSTGRLTSTVAYLFSFIIIYRYASADYEKTSTKAYILIVGIVFAGILLYFIRYATSLRNSLLDKGQSISFFEALTSSLSINTLRSTLIDHGNLPNIQVLMTIIKSWGNDVGFLWGQSLFWWIYNILPTSIRDHTLAISAITKQTWYLEAPGGTMPPTIVGEMFANFGFLGIVIGLFFLGAMSACFYNYMQKRQSFWILFIYSAFAAGFLFISPKTDTQDLTRVFWMVILPILTILVIKVVSTSVIKFKTKYRQTKGRYI